jgi:hypothetical protein
MRRNAFGRYAQKAKFPGDLSLSHETKNLLGKKVAANGKTGEIVRVYFPNVI